MEPISPGAKLPGLDFQSDGTAGAVQAGYRVSLNSPADSVRFSGNGETVADGGSKKGGLMFWLGTAAVLGGLLYLFRGRVGKLLGKSSKAPTPPPALPAPKEAPEFLKRFEPSMN
jgi:hypothetical protein